MRAEINATYAYDEYNCQTDAANQVEALWFVLPSMLALTWFGPFHL